MKNRHLLGKRAVQKGKWWENEYCKRLELLLKEKFRRTRASEKRLHILTGDIFCLNRNSLYFQDLSFQIKAREVGNPFAWWSKTKDDAKGKLPIIIWQKANQPNLVFLSLKDFCKLIYELEGFRKKAQTSSKK